MIYLQWHNPPSDVESVRAIVQQAIDVEFATLPPYLYALMSIREDKNRKAMNLVKSVALEEMVHMCLACNILNAIGGAPQITTPVFPGPLPGDIGDDGGKALIVHLYPFSEQAMYQGMQIEEPVDPPEFPDLKSTGMTAKRVTIGEFYELLDELLKQLPDSAWQANRRQVDDRQFFQGQIFAVNCYADAHRAIDEIVSEGEGAPNDKNPLDLNSELAHFYRFEELYRNQVLVKTGDNVDDYAWGESLGVDFSIDGVYPAITDPQSYDFSNESEEVRQAQLECNTAFSEMVDHLQSAFNCDNGLLGNGVQSMFDIRMAAIKAFQTPLSDGQVAGPAFVYIPANERIVTKNKGALS